MGADVMAVVDAAMRSVADEERKLSEVKVALRKAMDASNRRAVETLLERVGDLKQQMSGRLDVLGAVLDVCGYEVRAAHGDAEGVTLSPFRIKAELARWIKEQAAPERV